MQIVYGMVFVQVKITVQVLLYSFDQVIISWQTEFKAFVKHESAGEIGTTRASINRTAKTNAGKGVANHYNEYSEFHARELEAHVCEGYNCSSPDWHSFSLNS
jgi:hypothetical protein